MITRSPPLTRQRALNLGIELDNGGNQIWQRMNPNSNHNPSQSLELGIGRREMVDDGGGLGQNRLLDEQQLRNRLLTVTMNNNNNPVVHVPNENVQNQRIAMNAPLVNSGIFGSNNGNVGDYSEELGGTRILQNRPNSNSGAINLNNVEMVPTYPPALASTPVENFGNLARNSVNENFAFIEHNEARAQYTQPRSTENIRPIFVRQTAIHSHLTAMRLPPTQQPFVAIDFPEQFVQRNTQTNMPQPLLYGNQRQNENVHPNLPRVTGNEVQQRGMHINPGNFPERVNAPNADEFHLRREMHDLVLTQAIKSLDNFSYSMTLNSLPELKGNTGSDTVRAFFRHFDVATEEWPEAKRLSALRSKCSGRAERAFNVAVSNNPFRYENVKRSMVQQLEEMDARQMSAFDELMSGISRRNNERIDDLADRVSSLVRKAYPGLLEHLYDDYSIRHFIRALQNPELALTLELARRPSMIFDEFVALAARAEATQKASKLSLQKPRNIPSFQDHNQSAQYNSRPIQQPFRNENLPRNNQSQNRQNCYNCGRFGHFARQCNYPRQVRIENSNIGTPATGANQTTVEVPKNTAQPQYNKSLPFSRNYLRQNFLVEQQENPPPASQNFLVGGISMSHAELEKLFENDKSVEVENSRTKLLNVSVGKIMVIKVSVCDLSATAMLDGGAQVSLVSFAFFSKIMREKNLDKIQLCPTRKSTQVVDINGKAVEYVGVVSLPIVRKNTEVWIRFHVTNASFGYEFLFGTNALARLNFKLYDAQNQEMINFAEVDSEEKNSVHVIYRTTLLPQAMTLVELASPMNFEGKNVAVFPNSEKGIKIEPTLTVSEKGKLIVPITNFSSLPITLEKNKRVGNIELVENFGETEDFFLSPLIAYGRQQNEPRIVQKSEQNVNKLDTMRKIWVPKIKNLEEGQIGNLDELVRQFENIFALYDYELTQTSLVEHNIDTGSAAPVKNRMRPVPYAYREKVAEMLRDYLGRGIIKSSISPWASPIVLVPKRDGSLRFCVDYRGINAVTKKDAFPLPNIDYILMALGGKKYFATLDFMSGYWQIRMSEDSVQKTAFTTEFGLHEFNVLPFGLCNAVATYQRFMTRLFNEMVNDFVFIYVDDILVASETWDTHLKHLEQVFERVSQAELKLKIDKCCFAAEELPFLGHILTTNGIKMDADKIRPILELPFPSTKKQLQSFLGFMTYYRKFIYGFGSLAAPLFHLIKENTPFVMGEKEQQIVTFLKRKVLEDVVLYFPDFKAAAENTLRRFVILTDASKFGISAVLCQPDEFKNVRPIYFASRQCNKYESKYCPTELEALAIRFGTRKFSQFITGIPCRVITGHKALIPMFRSKKETGNARVDRWLMEVNARYQLSVEYQPGKQNVVADLLSRVGKQSDTENVENLLDVCPSDVVVIKKLSMKEIKTNTDIENMDRKEWIDQTKSSELIGIYEFLEKRATPQSINETQSLMDKINNFALIEQLLYFVDQKTGSFRLFVPEKYRKELIKRRHEGKCAGHLSGKKLWRQLGELYFWPNMMSDCLKFALSCRICAHSRKPRKNEPPMQIVKTLEPLELVCLDILSIGPSESENRYVLVAIDHFTKYLIAVPISNKNSETVARAFVNEFILVFGTPKCLHSDRGGEFVNETLTEISKLLGVEKSVTSGYDPQANGVTERANQTILNMLRKSTGSNWSWDERLPFIVFCYNTTPSEVTGFSPYQLLFGKPANFPGEQDVNWQTNPNYTIDEETYIQLFRENLKDIISTAVKNSEIAREKSKKYYDKRPNVTENKFSKGDRCMVLFPGSNARSPHKKLLWNNFGPYKIVEISKSSAKVVPVDKNAEPILVPIERLIKVPPELPNISTLPRGKNMYRNVLNALIAPKSWSKKKNDRIGPKKLEIEGSLNCQLGTIEFLDGMMELDKDESYTLAWSSICDGVGHEICSKVKCMDLDPVLETSSEIGQIVVKTPLQALLSAFLFRSGSAVSASAAQELVRLVVKSDPGFELILYEGGRRDNVKSGTFPTVEQMEDIWHIWSKNCVLAKEILANSGFSTITVINNGKKIENTLTIQMAVPPALEKLTESEKTGWTTLFDNTGLVLERVRAKLIHNATTFIDTPRVLVGDSSCHQLLAEMRDKTHFVGVERGPLPMVIRALSDCVLSSNVQAVLICVGRDSLVQSETVDQMMEQCVRLKQMCNRFCSAHVFWIPPPYVRQRDKEFGEFVTRLAQLVPEWFVGVTTTGRSILEIFRHGDTFDTTRVAADGWMSREGVKTLAAWVQSQIASFPGNKELGIRAVRSVVHVVRQNRSGDSGPGDRPPLRSITVRSGLGRDDHPVSGHQLRMHPYRGFGRGSMSSVAGGRRFSRWHRWQ